MTIKQQPLRDWSLIEEHILFCHCGTFFRGKARVEDWERRHRFNADRTCPTCGRADNVSRRHHLETARLAGKTLPITIKDLGW
jgi:hypothetical protein